jgi:hypothetical protein
MDKNGAGMMPEISRLSEDLLEEYVRIMEVSLGACRSDAASAVTSESGSYAAAGGDPRDGDADADGNGNGNGRRAADGGSNATNEEGGGNGEDQGASRQNPHVERVRMLFQSVNRLINLSRPLEARLRLRRFMGEENAKRAEQMRVLQHSPER